MTVADLIEALEAFPPELRVLVDGYEFGYDEMSLETKRVVAEKHGWWAGDYNDAGKDSTEAFDALVLSR